MRRLLKFLGSKKERKGLILKGLFLLNILVWVAFLSFPGRNLNIYFFDVGQGDAIFVRLPERRTILIDGGPSEEVLVQLGRAMPYWENQLDLIVISHWDADHITGLAGVFEAYEVAAVAYPTFDCESMICLKVMDLIDQERARKMELKVGDRLRFGGAVLDFYWPPGDCSLGSNDCSAVFLLGVGDFEGLFTGDFEERGQRGMLKEMEIPRVEVLKVPHHGADCLDQSFLNAVSPVVSIISVGENSYGHPTASTLKNLDKIDSKIYRTDVHGTVKVVSNGRSWWVE
jgi:competence protein ComEC